MRNTNKFITLITVALIGCLMLTATPGCQTTAGNEAREQAVAALDIADDSVEASVLAGAEAVGLDVQTINDFFYAVGTEDRAQVAAVVYLWPLMEQAAQAGIQARVDSGEIGPGVGQSLNMRVAEFERLLYLVAQ